MVCEFGCWIWVWAPCVLFFFKTLSCYLSQSKHTKGSHVNCKHAHRVNNVGCHRGKCLSEQQGTPFSMGWKTLNLFHIILVTESDLVLKTKAFSWLQLSCHKLTWANGLAELGYWKGIATAGNQAEIIPGICGQSVKTTWLLDLTDSTRSFLTWW